MTLATIYDTQLAWVLQTLRRLGVRDTDVDDVAHDLFIVVQRKLGTFDPARPLRPWLFGIAYRVTRDYLRSTRRRQLLVVPTSPGESAVDTRADARQQLKRVLDALGTLGHERRATFVMHEIDGFSVPEIAVVLGLSTNTLYSHLRRARAQLQALLVDAQEAGRERA